MTDAPSSMSLLEAIYSRRAVRDYTPRKIDGDTIRKLLDAAVQAPSAMFQQPWAFVVIQDTAVLKRLSETAKEKLREEAASFPPEKASYLLDKFDKPDSHIFYNAGTLIGIYGKQTGPFVEADCWLAAENLMLAACAMGLGTCVIGLATSALNTSAWKKEFGVPESAEAFAALIVGEPKGATPPKQHKPPEILAWK